MRMIYICSPLRGVPPYSAEQTQSNIIRAAEYSRNVAEAGYIPIAPHLYFSTFLDDSKADDRTVGIEMGLKLLEKCDMVWVFGRERSEGMQAEISHAENLGKPVTIIIQD